jgi:hypothetical protein
MKANGADCGLKNQKEKGIRSGWRKNGVEKALFFMTVSLSAWPQARRGKIHTHQKRKILNAHNP